MAVMSYQKFG